MMTRKVFTCKDGGVSLPRLELVIGTPNGPDRAVGRVERILQYEVREGGEAGEHVVSTNKGLAISESPFILRLRDSLHPRYENGQ